MSFYITLPSYSSFSDFPNNTLTHYITHGNYEVALAQIVFSKNCKYRQDGSVLINHPERSTRINVEFYVWATISELLNKLTENIILLAEVHVEFKFDKNTSKVFLAVPPECTLLLEGGLDEVFGFKSNSFNGSLETIYSADNIININLNNTINSIYLYSDICEYQMVGDTESPLLLQVVSTINSTNDYIEKFFTSPHYVPLARNNLETVEIDIRSDLGKPILHFRKRSFY